MRPVRVGWDYFAFAVWEFIEGEGWVNLDHDSLPLSRELIEDFQRWSDAQTEAHNGTTSIPASTIARWETDRLALVERLHIELGDAFEVDRK